MANHEKAPKSNDAENQETQELSIAERLSQINVHELKPEDIEFMNSTIQNFMRENCPVPGEIIDELPNHVKILGPEDFKEVYEKQGETRPFDLDDTTGFFNTEDDTMYINANIHRSPEHLFGTMMHESNHYAAINNGAGFQGGFAFPTAAAEDPENVELGRSGLTCAREGATELPARNTLEIMGVSTDDLCGYEADVHICDRMFGNLPSEDLIDRYYACPLEQFRQEVEACIIEDDAQRMDFIEHRESDSTGAFINAIMTLGAVKRDLIIALNRNDRATIDEIDNDIDRAMQYYNSRREALNV